MLPLVPVLLAAAPPQTGPDLWALAQKNARVLRVSTLICADQVIRYLSDDAGIDRAIDWCRDHGITHVYLESFRDGLTVPTRTLAHARDRFRARGVLVSGCITTTKFGKHTAGWGGVACYTNAGTREQLRGFFTTAAGLFDEIMIDDFLFTDCQCAECQAAKGSRSWPDFRCDLMLSTSKADILAAAHAVNPKARVIIKYPCWHEEFQERGYDVDRQTAAFDETWVGTETRGGVPGSNWTAEPQYRAYWLMRWLLGIGGAKCGGGWYDWLGTSPPYYLEQARQTVLGGAREAMLFNFGALYSDRLGKQDIEAWRAELPLHFELARLIAGKGPRGILGWKPASSPAGPDRNLHALLGMCGFPVTAAHTFTASAPAFVFGHQALHDAGWRQAAGRALATGRPVLVTQDFLRSAGDSVPGLRERAILLPASGDANHWDALAKLPELDTLRDRAMKGIGSLHAPANVALYLFGADIAVVESFRDEPVECTLQLDGWPGAEAALTLPVGAASAEGAQTVHLSLAPRSLVVLRRRK